MGTQQDLALEIFRYLESMGGCRLGEIKEKFKDTEKDGIDIMHFVNGMVKSGSVIEIEFVIPLDNEQTIFKTGSFFLPGHARIL